MVKAVLFDLDETLFDRVASVRAFVARQFASDYGSFPSADALAERFTLLDDRGNVPKSKVYPQIFEEMGQPGPDIWRGFFLDFEENAWRLARPYPGMRQTLTALRNQGLRLGIVTNGQTRIQLRSILALGLDRLVDTYLISETEALRKPDADIFLLAAERLGVRPADCAFVGDTPQADMIGARSVDMRTIWFPNGMRWPDTYDWRPDAEISHLSELIALCAQPPQASAPLRAEPAQG